MNPYLAHKAQYFQLIEHFLDDQLSAEAFSRQFTDLWAKDRDASYDSLDEAGQTQEKQIIVSYRQGRLTDEAFDAAWNKLWSMPKDETSFFVLIDYLATACFSLVESLDGQNENLEDYQVDESGLKKLVLAQWSNYKGQIERASEYSLHNRKQLEKSNQAACYHCLRIFNPAEIVEYIDNDDTAICPYCGIDSVLADHNLPYQLDKDTLEKLKEHWFSPLP